MGLRNQPLWRKHCNRSRKRWCCCEEQNSPWNGSSAAVAAVAAVAAAAGYCCQSAAVAAVGSSDDGGEDQLTAENCTCPVAVVVACRGARDWNWCCCWCRRRCSCDAGTAWSTAKKRRYRSGQSSRTWWRSLQWPDLLPADIVCRKRCDWREHRRREVLVCRASTSMSLSCCSFCCDERGWPCSALIWFDDVHIRNTSMITIIND